MKIEKILFSEIISSHCEIWIFVLDSQFFYNNVTIDRKELDQDDPQSRNSFSIDSEKIGSLYFLFLSE